ncbi:MAG: sugar transporter [Hasllibacter sp.]
MNDQTKAATGADPAKAAATPPGSMARLRQILAAAGIELPEDPAARRALAAGYAKATREAQRAAGPKRPAAPGRPTPFKAEAPAIPVRPVVGPARRRKRHRVLIWAFFAIFVLPTIAAGAYLYGRATDQYASRAGFTVRSDDSAPGIDLLGGLAALGGGSTNADAEILFEYIRSPELLREIDAELPLREMWTIPWRADDPSPVASLMAGGDPVFALAPNASIEELHDYWRRMVRVELDDGTGLVELSVTAFRPDDARDVARAVLDRSSALINALSAQARADATRYAEDELAAAEARLTAARQALTSFRSETRIVDPLADIQGQMGLLASLEAQLTEAMIEADLLAEQTRQGDPRLDQAVRRIEVIRERIEEERARFSAEDGPQIAGRAYATVVAEFERLAVDREFAEAAYTAALAALDASRAEAQRQSLYLATFVRPTLAETPEFPRRAVLLGLFALFSFLAWAIATLVYYAVRDRR